MKQQSFHLSLISLLVTSLLLSYSISARPLRKGAKETKEGFLNQLMGSDSEECEEKDEDCLKRRTITEVSTSHLLLLFTCIYFSTQLRFYSIIE